MYVIVDDGTIDDQVIVIICANGVDTIMGVMCKITVPYDVVAGLLQFDTIAIIDEGA